MQLPFEIYEKLATRFGFKFEEVTQDDQKEFFLDDWVYIGESIEPITCETIAGKREVPGAFKWYVSIAVHDPGSYDEPPSTDYHDVDLFDTFDEAFKKAVELATSNLIKNTVQGEYEARLHSNTDEWI